MFGGDGVQPTTLRCDSGCVWVALRTPWNADGDNQEGVISKSLAVVPVKGLPTEWVTGRVDGTMMGGNTQLAHRPREISPTRSAQRSKILQLTAVSIRIQ